MISVSAAVLMAAISVTVNEVATKVQGVYEKAQNYRAHFVQEVTLKTIDKVERDEGTVSFKKPGKMRWEYRKGAGQPVLQLIVTNGETIWFYTPAEKQVLMDKIDRAFSSQAAMNFLSGMGNLKEEFTVKLAKDKGVVDKDKYYLLDLKPKKAPKDLTGRLMVAVSKDTYRVDQALIDDQFGNRTRITFNNVEINADLPDSLFTFEVPKGVEVIRPPKK